MLSLYFSKLNDNRHKNHSDALQYKNSMYTKVETILIIKLCIFALINICLPETYSQFLFHRK